MHILYTTQTVLFHNQVEYNNSHILQALELLPRAMHFIYMAIENLKHSL